MKKFKVGDYVIVTTTEFDRVGGTQYGLSGHITEIKKNSYLPIWVKYDDRSCSLYGIDKNTYDSEHLELHPVSKTKLYKALK